jgi:hypothetical protein
MSVWCTILDLEHPDQTAAELAADGIRYHVIGDDSEQRKLGSPYVYQGSHVVPTSTCARGGSVDLAQVPNFLHPNADRDLPGKAVYEDDMRFPVEFMRLSVDQDPATYGHEDSLGQATVVLDRRHVTVIRDAMTRWLEHTERW